MRHITFFRLLLVMAGLWGSSALGQVPAMPAAVPLPHPRVQFFDTSGRPLAGGKVYTYAAGTTTPQATYTDASATTPNANPVILDSGGFADIWISGTSYKIVVQNSAGVQQWTADNVTDITFFYISHLKTVSDASVLSYTAPVTGGIQRTLSGRLAENLNIRDFGAACDGTTDDTAILTAALSHVSNLLIGCPVYLASSVTIPSGVNVTFQKPGLLNAASGATVTWAGTFTAPNYQIFTGSGTYALHNRPAVTNALWFPGADIGAQINAAATALGLGCGHILVPRTNNGYSFSTPINLDNTLGCELDGGGGATGGTPTNNVYWTYTGSGSATILSARSTVGIKIHGMSILATSASFSGKGIDLSHSSLGADTFQAEIYNINLNANGGGAYSICVDFAQAIDSTLRNSLLNNYVVGVNGASDGSPGYSNSNHIEKVSFEAGPMSTYSILNPGEAWLISSNTFENNTANLVPIGCTLSEADEARAAGVAIVANWFGDWANSGTTSEIEVCGHGWSVTGNFLAGPGGTPTFTVFTISGGVAGFSATGNIFDITGTGTQHIANIGSPSANVMITANMMESVPTSFLVGTCISGYITDYAGNQLCPVPAGPLSGSFNGASAAGLPSTVAGGGFYLTGGYASPVSGAMYIGDGTGYQFDIRKRSGGTDTVFGQITDQGVFNFPVFNATTTFKLNGTSGYSGTVTCSAGQHINSITISGGIITAAPTCN